MNNERMTQKELEDFFKNQGIAIYVKGRMILGIHPDNLENNAKALDEGNLKINWVEAIKRVSE